MDGSAPVVILLGEGAPRTRAALEAAGAVVRRAGEAELLSARGLPRPGLLVLDDDGPREGRAATLARLRAHPVLHGVPVIVASTDCGIDSFGGAIARGAAAFLRKPVDPEELRDAARRLMAWREDAGPRNTRRGLRRPLLLACDLHPAGRPAGPARLLDVSAGGCRLEAGEPVVAGTAVAIVPRACEDSTEIRLGGTVQWCRRAGARDFALAVRWSGTTALFARRLFGIPGAP